MSTIRSEVVSDRRRLRHYSDAFKAQMVTACRGFGVSVAEVVLKHGLNANPLRCWINQAEG
ncbi:transposase [Burkholderia ubonensis]|uniref:transposase n=1 Tax=Burkholderia ubonensis TaxID=101571 RepID=UPI000A657503